MLGSPPGWVCRLGYMVWQSYWVDFKVAQGHCSRSLVMCIERLCSTVGLVYWFGSVPGWGYRRVSEAAWVLWQGFLNWWGIVKAMVSSLAGLIMFSCPGEVVEWIPAGMAYWLGNEIRHKCQMRFLARQGHQLGSGDWQSCRSGSLLEWCFK